MQATLGHAKSARPHPGAGPGGEQQILPVSAGNVEGMLDFVKPYLPGNAPMLSKAVYWMRRYQREAFFEALHALGVPVSPGMLSGLIWGYAAMRNGAAARVAFEKWTAQGVPTTIDVWKALASIHVYQPNPQARLGNHACCTALPGMQW